LKLGTWKFYVGYWIFKESLYNGSCLKISYPFFYSAPSGLHSVGFPSSRGIAPGYHILPLRGAKDVRFQIIPQSINISYPVFPVKDVSSP
jgi:hypothetical protein